MDFYLESRWEKLNRFEIIFQRYEKGNFYLYGIAYKYIA